MRERPTVRVLLLGPDKRILLIRFHDDRLNGAKVFWATVGGGRDPGESVTDAALREIREETGLTDVTLGPVVWWDDVVITVDGEPVFFRETYIVAHAPTTELTFDGWTDLEREVIKDMRWFTVPEIKAATEQVYPEVLAAWLPDILAGNYPDQPYWIPREAHERAAPILTDME
jgi:8-oxo-dGTP pyrophosphatase MutT (NUDIX family)